MKIPFHTNLLNLTLPFSKRSIEHPMIAQTKLVLSVDRFEDGTAAGIYREGRAMFAPSAWIDLPGYVFVEWSREFSLKVVHDWWDGPHHRVDLGYVRLGWQL